MKSKYSYLLAVGLTILGLHIASGDLDGGIRIVILGAGWYAIAEIQTIKERMR